MLKLPAFKTRHQFLLVCLLWAMLAAQIYLFTNTPGAPTLALWEIDRRVPYIELSVIGYISIYLLMLWACLRITDMKFATQYLCFWMLLQFTAMFVYLLFPVSYPREIFTQTQRSDSAITEFIQFWHRLDGPANCLPSLHVSTSIMAFLAFTRRARSGEAFSVLSTVFASSLSIVTIISTLTFKQHYFVDLLGGALQAGIVYWLVFRSGLIRVHEP
jgi:membrane-associated phospholipid phosphatase